MPVATTTRHEDAMEGTDTIVVKNTDNKYWAHQSSPESSPEVEPIVANLLASANGPQNHLQDLESPEPDDPDDLPSTEQHTKEDESSAKPVSFRDDDRAPMPGTSEERLLQMPELRALPWREGVDPASENLVGGDSRRKQIKFGCLLATRGEVQKVPCTTCTNGRGKFSLCIALEGFFKGACASCQLSGGPNRCSIKQQDDEDGSPGGRSSEKPRKSSTKSSKRPPSREGSQPKQIRKRRKTTDMMDQQPEWDSTRPQWQQESNDIRPQPAVVQSPWAVSQAPHALTTPLPPISQHPPSNGSNGYRNSLYHPANAVPPPLERNVSSDNSPRPLSERRISSGWAAVNKPTTPQTEQIPPSHHSHYMPSHQPPPTNQIPSQHPPLPPAPPSIHHYQSQPQYHQSPYTVPPSSHQTQSQSSPSSHLQSQPPPHYSPYTMPPPVQHNPSNPASQPPHSPHQPGPAGHSLLHPGSNFPPIDHERRDNPSIPPPNSAYIDSLPAAKQRQLYGIVSGIQGGIKHLQSELETLKRALGMEEGF